MFVKTKKISYKIAKTCNLLQCNIEDFVCANQTHSANVHKVTLEDKGRGATELIPQFLIQMRFIRMSQTFYYVPLQQIVYLLSFIMKKKGSLV